jgi:hypothetical protein
VAEWRAATNALHFQGAAAGPTRAGFAAYYRVFRAMLSDTNLAAGTGWLARSRTWRLALLQEPDGGYGPSEGLAGVVSAVDDADDDDDVLAGDVAAMMAAMPRALLDLAGVVAGEAAPAREVLQSPGGGDAADAAQSPRRPIITRLGREGPGDVYGDATTQFAELEGLVDVVGARSAAAVPSAASLAGLVISPDGQAPRERAGQQAGDIARDIDRDPVGGLDAAARFGFSIPREAGNAPVPEKSVGRPNVPGEVVVMHSGGRNPPPGAVMDSAHNHGDLPPREGATGGGGGGGGPTLDAGRQLSTSQPISSVDSAVEGAERKDDHAEGGADVAAASFGSRVNDRCPGVDTRRVWATLLARAAAECAEHTWLVSGSIWTEADARKAFGGFGFGLCANADVRTTAEQLPPLTIVDAATDYLRRRTEGPSGGPAHQLLLAMPQLEAAAAGCVRRWAARRDASVGAMRQGLRGVGPGAHEAVGAAGLGAGAAFAVARILVRTNGTLRALMAGARPLKRDHTPHPQYTLRATPYTLHPHS